MFVQWHYVSNILKFVPLYTLYFKDILQIKICCVLTNIMNLFKIINAILSIVYVLENILFIVFFMMTL